MLHFQYWQWLAIREAERGAVDVREVEQWRKTEDAWKTLQKEVKQLRSQY